jgi:hypothetical protein
MQAGVPEGPVLSPKLSNMYINNTPQTIGVYLRSSLCWRHLSVGDKTQGGLSPKKISARAQLTRGVVQALVH